MRRKIIQIAVGTGIGILVAAQFIRPARENPPSDPAESFAAVLSPPHQLSAALDRACGDCHSNETVWPWYSHIAPVGWLVAQDVRKGRAHLNLSEWGRYGPRMSRQRVADMCDEVKRGEMPLWYFRLVHPEARLSAREAAILCTLPGEPRAARAALSRGSRSR